MTKDIFVVLGPTASGKSSLAMLLARELNGEVISCDSMQVYQGMAIGTAQPSAQDLEEIPHHLINCFDIHTCWDANLFVKEAQKIVVDVQSRGKTPIIVGGTGMYAKAFAYDLPLQPSDKEIFTQVCAEYDAGKEEELRAELLATNEEIHIDVLKNWRRLVRAVEILRITGKAPIVTSTIMPKENVKQIILLPEWSWLKQRIAQRCSEMLQCGWIEEAMALDELGLLTTPTARQALGYSDIINWHKSGSGNLAEIEEILITKTNQYARRQRTWFKKQHPGANIFEPNNSQEWDEMANDILSQIVK